MLKRYSRLSHVHDLMKYTSCGSEGLSVSVRDCAHYFLFHCNLLFLGMSLNSNKFTDKLLFRLYM